MAALVEGKVLRRTSRMFDFEGENDGMSETDRLYKERLQRYCMLLAKEREVLQKLERARRASTAGLQWMDSESQLTTRTRTASIDPKVFSSNDGTKTTRKCSVQAPLTRRTSLVDITSSRRLSQPAQFPVRCSTPSNDKSVPEQRILRPLTRKAYGSQTDLTSSKIRVLESQRKSAQRMQRMQSLDEDCEKAKQLMKKFKSMSLTRLDLISDESVSNNDEARKQKSKSWLI